MASKRAVLAALKVLACNFAGAVTEEKAKLWLASLNDVTDEQLERAIPDVIRSHRGEFIPPVAVIRDAAGANSPPDSPDVERIVSAIEALASYNPAIGTTWPRIEYVAAKLGDAIGEAYAIAGGASRLFSTEETTRDIAMRDLQKALTSVSRRHRVPPEFAVGARPLVPQLAAGTAGQLKP